MNSFVAVIIASAGLAAAQNITGYANTTVTGVVVTNSTVTATITSCGTGGCHKPTNGTNPTILPPVTSIPIANGAGALGGSVALVGVAAAAYLL